MSFRLTRRSATTLSAALFVILGEQAATAASHLVLSKGRVEVTITWRSQYDGTTGVGIGIPVSDVFGFFAFTDPANPEVFVKVLDFGATSPLLLFYGGLTDFEYHLTFHNRCTGQDVHLDKAAGTFDGGADNRSMLAGCAAGPVQEPGGATWTDGAASRAGVPRDFLILGGDLQRERLATTPTLSLSKDRIEVGLTWKSQYDGSTGSGIATPINGNFGFLSFTDPNNPEVFVKVLDFGSSSPLLLFYGGLTDFEYEVTYRNLCTNETVVLRKPPGSFAGGADNKTMFARCEEAPLPPHLVAIRSVEQKLTSLLQSGAGQLESVRAVAAYMATLPEYTVSGVDEESRTAWGVLKNGRPHLVINNRVLDSPRPAFQAPERPSTLAGAELPKAGYARLLQSFGSEPLTQKPVEDLARLLEDPGGYVVRSTPGDARLTVLRAVNGDGFFYFNTHAGLGYTTLDDTGPGYYMLESSSVPTAGTDKLPEIVADFAAGRLVYASAAIGNAIYSTAESRYGINSNFVKHYWHFSENAIVFFNACNGATNHPRPREFVDACWAAGAGVVFAWNGLANADSCFEAARYFVDRVIGASEFLPPSPGQRAFPWDAVYEDMKTRGLTVDKDTKGVLTPLPRPGSPPSLLDPSIKYMLVNEYEGKLILKGAFGSIPGKVSIGGEVHEDCVWKIDEIVCPMSVTAVGDVFVEARGEQSRTRKSNIRQLTEWDIPLHYLWANAYLYPGLTFEGTSTLRYRADVGGWREKPGEDLVFPLRGLTATRDSALTVVGSGSFATGGCTITLSGSGTFPVHGDTEASSRVLIAPMKVDGGKPHTGAIGLGFGALLADVPHKLTYTGTCSGSSPLAVNFGLLEGLDQFPSPYDDAAPPLPFLSLPLTLNDDFVLLKLKHEDPTLAGLTVEWKEDVQPISPPKASSAR